MLAQLSIVAIFSSLVSGLATAGAASLDIATIPVGDQMLSTKHCNNNFRGWEHDHYEKEFLAEINTINGSPYSHLFEGYINAVFTSISIACENCSILDSKNILRNMWDLSKDHHCSYSQIEDRNSKCSCSLDYDYRF